ncbi:TRAP transporter substrate-binding protein DctP [Arcobacter sp. YIC-80]|uniref:TRAP transporter substrate-binding protein DctP n=1 Tax=Arcobacter sp. YIC-80 TaxID=3376683 RepID=UPI00384C93E0
MLRSILLVCLVGAVAVNAKTLRLSTYVNSIDVRYKGFEHFADLVKKKSNGKLKIKIYGSSTLHGWSEGVDAVLGGVTDISWLPSDKRLKCQRVTALYPAVVDFKKQIETDAKYTELLEDELSKNNLKVIFNSNYSYDQEWWFKEPIADLTKLDGKQVRSPYPVISEMIKQWGGNPVFISPKEVFQSAERGVVDGVSMGVATYSSWKLWGVMPHMVNGSLFYGNTQYVINKSSFEKLSKEHQKILLESAKESEVWLKPRYEAWVNERVGQAIMEGGGSAYSLDIDKRKDIVKKIQAIWDVKVKKECGEDLANKIKELVNQ